MADSPASSLLRRRVSVVVLAFAVPAILSLLGVTAYDPGLPLRILAVLSGVPAVESEAVPPVEPVLCTCPECDCVCRGGTSAVCKCKHGTCDCPCPHVQCGPDGCRLIPGKGGDEPVDLPGELKLLPLPPAPPALIRGFGFQQAGTEPAPRALAWDLPPEIRGWYRNLTNPGSCVQCSIGMAGVEQNVIEASTLLWTTRYGKAELHGSWPQRVEDYCRHRGIRIYNVTGRPTYDWMQWAARNKRPVAIACNTAHFQTLCGYDPASKTWYVCNNNSPDRIDAYSDAEFRRRHEASAAWCVVLDYPPSPRPPVEVAWWGPSSPAS